MDESDLERDDPKRVGLEGDRIIVEFTKNALKSLLDAFPTKLQNDIERLSKETQQDRKTVIKYLINQKRLLIKLIDVYQNELYKLVKEDSL
jgi:phosphate uptake regulator